MALERRQRADHFSSILDLDTRLEIDSPVQVQGKRGLGGEPGHVEVEIGELVLDGFPRVDRDLVAAAFSRELTRLLRERGVPIAADGDATIDAMGGLPPLPPTIGSRRLGVALARSVHSGLSGAAERSRR